jgi:hypothetical protein
MFLNLGIHFHCIRCAKRTQNKDQRHIDAVWFDAHIPTHLDFLCPDCYEELTGPGNMTLHLKMVNDQSNGIPANATKYVKQTNLRIA